MGTPDRSHPDFQIGGDPVSEQELSDSLQQLWMEIRGGEDKRAFERTFTGLRHDSSVGQLFDREAGALRNLEVQYMDAEDTRIQAELKDAAEAHGANVRSFRAFHENLTRLRQRGLPYQESVEGAHDALRSAVLQTVPSVRRAGKLQFLEELASAYLSDDGVHFTDRTS